MAPGVVDYPPPGRSEHHWPPMASLAVAIVLQYLLPDRLIPGPPWLLPGLEGLLALRLIVASPYRISGRNRTRRRISLAVTALVSATNAVSLVLLSRLLLEHHPVGGRQLIVAGSLIWLTNVLLFALWYWELDRGGPGVRAEGEDATPDLLFPQMSTDGPWTGWRPRFLDYLYVSLTNATAFSPTDTMPLSVDAKMVMGLQSIISLVTIGLIVARAVNIL